MKTFKKLNSTKPGEYTTILFCKAEKAPNENFEECEEIEIDISGCEHLYTQAGVKYYGFL